MTFDYANSTFKMNYSLYYSFNFRGKVIFTPVWYYSVFFTLVSHWNYLISFWTLCVFTQNKTKRTLFFALIFQNLISEVQKHCLFAQKTHFSQIFFFSQICLKLCWVWAFSFAEIIPPIRIPSGISRCWLDGKNIAQLCLRLDTIKRHSEMCSFAVWRGSENQSVSCVTTICLLQCNTSPSHSVIRLEVWPVECWSTPLQWLRKSCWMLAGAGTTGLRSWSRYLRAFNTPSLECTCVRCS